MLVHIARKDQIGLAPEKVRREIAQGRLVVTPGPEQSVDHKKRRGKRGT